MRALVATGNPSSPLQMHDVDEPTPAANQVLLETRNLSLNRGELRLLASRPQGWRPGQDVAGTVIGEALDGSGPPRGSRVVAMVDQAGWAERVAAPTTRVAQLPRTVTFAQAATLPIAGLTALRALRLGGMLLGRNVLITGASGGVGQFAVQLAANASAHVTAVSRNPDRGKALTKSGDVRLITAQDMQSLEPSFDLILESVGGQSLTQSLKLVARDGTVVLFGNSSGEDSTVSFASFAGRAHAKLYAFFVYESGEPPTFGSDLALLVGEIAEGRLVPQVGLEASWRDPMGALEALRQRSLEGKAVLVVD
jgi:NADPH:quinone reductase-like Zn-dependent oxidoreductase